MDNTKFINPHQLAGVESYLFADGPARNTRALLFNTGAGLRFRVLPDRGLDIDQCFLHQHSLSFLTHASPAAPSRAYDLGADWLKNFSAGLLTSCGPFNIGPPANDNGETLGLHGTHSNSVATVESVIQPDPLDPASSLSVTGLIRYGSFYGPNLELRRTISCRLNSTRIDITDRFKNLANTAAPHAWLLHINFGHPLMDHGAEFCYDAARVEPLDTPESLAHFAKGAKVYKSIPGPLAAHDGPTSNVAYLYPKPADGPRAAVAIVNPALSLAVAVHYDTTQFPRCGNWQHYGLREYVCALEPMNGTIAGRDKDRAAGLLDSIPPLGTKVYHYSIEAVTDPAAIAKLRALNSAA